jgi:hypothetical protein
MALPPIDVDEDLEAEDEDELPEMEDEALEPDPSADLDPMFAADAAEAFPDLDDAGLMALQRAILSLLGGSMPPPTDPMGGMGGAPLPF